MSQQIMVRQVEWDALSRPYDVPDGWTLHSLVPGLAHGATSSYAVITFIRDQR